MLFEGHGPYGTSPLHLAVHSGVDATVDGVLKLELDQKDSSHAAGAAAVLRVDDFGRTALHYAACAGDARPNDASR
jgi:hypothetical protein